MQALLKIRRQPKTRSEFELFRLISQGAVAAGLASLSGDGVAFSNAFSVFQFGISKRSGKSFIGVGLCSD